MATYRPDIVVKQSDPQGMQLASLVRVLFALGSGQGEAEHGPALIEKVHGDKVRDDKVDDDRAGRRQLLIERMKDNFRAGFDRANRQLEIVRDLQARGKDSRMAEAILEQMRVHLSITHQCIETVKSLPDQPTPRRSTASSDFQQRR
jgi:hypothetical protein